MLVLECKVRKVGDGRGKGQENLSSQNEANKVSQGSRPGPQEFWDKRPILYMQSGQDYRVLPSQHNNTVGLSQRRT